MLLLDEPTAGVDPQARREFWDQVQLMSQQGITTLVTTHYMDEAMRCNQLAYIVYGRMMVTGTAESIIEKSGLKTWQVTGSELLPLKEVLAKNEAVEQVAMFGNALHVSGHNADALKKIFDEFISGNQNAVQIETSLEDVFIMYVDKNRDTRHE